MAAIVDKYIINNPVLDRRVKLLESDKKEIREMRERIGMSYQKIANMYGVSKRLIYFICNPEKKAENLKQRHDRGGSKIYYDKDKATISMRGHRYYKKMLLDRGEDLTKTK